MLKRFFDILLSLTGLILLLPIFTFISLLIKLESQGPIFYQGIRTGQNGKLFRMFKFRTMIRDAEQQGGTSTAETDRRITRFGKILRRYKIDELPQLINVLKGEMSIVGPRPEVDEYTSLYTAEEKDILKVRPGITDFASVKFRHLNAILAKSDDPDLYYKDVIRPEKNRLRLKYARQNNFCMDLKIIFRTFRSLFLQ